MKFNDKYHLTLYYCFKYLFLLTACFVIWNCKTNSSSIPVKAFTNISIDTLLTDKISIRAILIDGNDLWYGADKGRYGKIDLRDRVKSEFVATGDVSKVEFRSIAQTSSDIFILNAGTPAQLFRIPKGRNLIKLCYSESFEKTFYDSMTFWNDMEGIAIGDPVENCLSVIITRDGGNSWTKMVCAELPNIVEGEAAFAASNSNVIVKGDRAWVVSGGKKSRVFVSHDKGKKWEAKETPIVQGSTMTGIFTSDFYNGSIGVIAGGDYEKQQQNSMNKAITTNGGKTWKLIAENSAFGYTSCIQFIPKSGGRELVSVGASGLWYSADQGKTWKQMLKDDTLYTIRFSDRNTAYAAGKNKIIRFRFH